MDSDFMCLTATWVGGTFIIGTAETVYDPKLGLIWAVMPLAATLAFCLGKFHTCMCGTVYMCHISHASFFRLTKFHSRLFLFEHWRTLTVIVWQCPSLFRWIFLCWAHEGQEVCYNNGSVPHQVWGQANRTSVCGSIDVWGYLGGINTDQFG